ncbi:MAG: HEAT repeat domain-containing protein [Armatimonadota bacterium]
MKAPHTGANLSGTLAASTSAAAVAQTAQTGGADESRAKEERRLIAVLRSDAPPFDKDVACRRLAVIGTKEAVPALAALLADEKLSGIARYGLEPIPDPSVNEALRAAMSELEGMLLVGVINSIGKRRDREAVAELTKLLGASDQAVAGAAASALGKIGGPESAQALERALSSAPAALRPAVADACLWCGQTLLAEGRRRRALALYDRVRKEDLPSHLVAAATRSAALARRSAGIPLLVEMLRSDDGELLGMALRLAREMPGGAVAKALSAELPKLPADRRELLSQALRDRGDAATPPPG